MKHDENKTEEQEVKCPIVKLKIEQENGGSVGKVKDAAFDLGLPNTGGPQEDDVIAARMTLRPGKSIVQNLTIASRGSTIQAFFKLPGVMTSDYRLEVRIKDTEGAEFTIFANRTVEQLDKGALNVDAYFQNGGSNLVVMVKGKQPVLA
jgi:hypothetical protein